MRHANTAILILAAAVATAATGAQENGGRQLADGRNSFYRDTVETSLAPASPFTGGIRDDLSELAPRVGIEIAVPIPVDPIVFSEDGILEVYNILRGISTMEGIEYYSASRDEMRIFYQESYAIDGPDDRTLIPDPFVDVIPERSLIFAYQRDGSFGRNVQRLEYTFRDGEILMSIKNVTTMTYRVFPLVAPGNLRTFLLIQPDREAGVLRFYGNLAVRVPALFGMEERSRDSFYNRIVALHAWFTDQLDSRGFLR